MPTIFREFLSVLANSRVPSTMPHKFIWVCTVCKVPIYRYPEWKGLYSPLQVHERVFTFSKQAFKWTFRVLQLLIASWMKWIWLTAAKLTCLCNTLWKSNSFASSDAGVVIDSEPHLSRTCKTSLLYVPLAVRVHTGCSAFPFNTPTKPLIRLHIKYKTVLFP